MFNLKRKVKQIIQSPADLVMEIHNEFDSVTDKLLAEAKRILSTDYNTEKGERLGKLGFTNSKPVIESIKAIELKKKQKEIAEWVEYYQMYYPNNKFITEDALKEICNKYGLIYAAANLYLGDVPEKNILEIEKFTLRNEDKDAHRCCYFDPDHFNAMYYQMRGLSTIPANRDRVKIWGWYELNQWGSYTCHSCEKDVEVEYTKKPMEIAAPPSLFKKEGMKVENFKLVEIPKDPIVLQPVKNGYLIVTKWGLEGKDESLVNEQHN